MLLILPRSVTRKEITSGEFPTSSLSGFTSFSSINSYKITSQVTRGNIPAAPITQDRRYSDFDWLVTELNRDFPGCIIAPLPEKTIVGKFASEFVESRRRSLGKLFIILKMKMVD